MNSVTPLDRTELARVAPNYEAMRTAIAKCEKLDEIAKLANQAVAVQAYFRQAQDVDNEMQTSRIRIRAERKMGEILKEMTAKGERAKRGEPVTQQISRGATSAPTLKNLGIPPDRASRAIQLANVPEKEFEAALAAPQVAQPRRILREVREPPKSVKPPPLVPIEQTLALWGAIRDFGIALDEGRMPKLDLWNENLQAFQLKHLRQYVPKIIAYLRVINRKLSK